MRMRTPGRHRGRRLAALGLALTTAVALAPFLTGPASAAGSPLRVARPAARPSATPLSRQDPRKSVPPSQRFLNACFAVTAKAPSQRACARAALRDLDKVRAAEGLARMSLPTTWATMSAPHQLLVLVNIERADRGLPVFPGLSRRLNGYAEKGARAATDPPFPSPFPGDTGGGNWAGTGTSTLLADYVWMYDDGVGSPNEDCHAKSDSGCWGHRHNIIDPYDAPRELGVAVARHGASMTQLFIGGDHTDHASAPLWSTLARKLRVGVTPTAATLHARAGGSARVRLTLWASGEAMHVHATLSPSGSIWSLSKSSCQLSAGTSCTIVVTVNPTSNATAHATVQVSGPHGSRLVHLAQRAAG